jgi:hypothetical protein
MLRFARSNERRLLVAALGVLFLFNQKFSAQAGGQSVVRQVRVLGSKDVVEIEVQASNSIVPQSQVLTGPDRLVVDFPNTVPGNEVRSQSVNRGEVKDVRVGRFQANPPITRVVLDLRSAQSYEIFPYGRTVMIKVLGNSAGVQSASIQEVGQSQSSRASLLPANYTASRERMPAIKPLEVTFHDGLLTIHAAKATLSEVLYQVQQRTGADITTPAGTEQERVVADLGPGPAQEVLAHLLKGSRFNFLILNAANDPRHLDRVILTPRVEGPATSVPLPPTPASDEADSDQEQVPPPPPVFQPPPAPPNPASVQVPQPHPGYDIPPDENSPDQ